METETIQNRILRSLLQSSKTTAELADKLGYVNKEGTILYSVINKDLKKLEKGGYIKSEKLKLLKEKRGITPTSYSIIFDIKNLRRMWEKYPKLKLEIQSSVLAAETIIYENFSWISNSADKEYVQIENLNIHKKRGKESWEEKLRMSLEFFSFCLKNDYIDMIESVRKFAQISSEYWETTNFELYTTPTSKVYLKETNYRIEMIFKACVAADILQGQAKKEAIEYLEQRKNEVLEEQYKQLKEYYSKTKVAPEFLRGKEFTSVENSKIQEIEQEFRNNGGKFIQYDV
jgi:hypothetical protein